MLVKQIIMGAVFGGILSFFGGIIGGGLARYFSSIARITDNQGRLLMARIASDNGKRIGTFSGVVSGATAAAVGDIVSLPVIIIGAGTLFAIVAWWLLQGTDDSVEGVID